MIVNFIKEAGVDCVVTGVIVLLVALGDSRLETALIAYTALMVGLKTITFLNRSWQHFLKRSRTPRWIFHLLYLSNVALLGFSGRWWLAGGWVMIYGLSVMTGRQVSRSTGKPSQKRRATA